MAKKKNDHDDELIERDSDVEDEDRDADDEADEEAAPAKSDPPPKKAEKKVEPKKAEKKEPKKAPKEEPKKAEPKRKEPEKKAAAKAPPPKDHGKGHGHGGDHHAPNRREYVKILIVLAVLTVLEVGVAYIQTSRALIISALIGLAIAKAAAVALYYMHLKHETKWMRWTVAFPVAFPALYAFILIAEGIYRALWGTA